MERNKNIDILMDKLKAKMVEHSAVGDKLREMYLEADKLSSESETIQADIKLIQADILRELAKDSPEIAKMMSKQFDIPLEPQVKSVLNREDEKKITVC